MITRDQSPHGYPNSQPYPRPNYAVLAWLDLVERTGNLAGQFFELSEISLEVVQRGFSGGRQQLRGSTLPYLPPLYPPVTYSPNIEVTPNVRQLPLTVLLIEEDLQNAIRIDHPVPIEQSLVDRIHISV